MEKVIGELYRSGDKFFVSAEECSRHEMREGIKEFLRTQGYQDYGGGLKIDGLGMVWHMFNFSENAIHYSHGQYQYANLTYKLCSPDIFKLFYHNMFQ